MIYPTLAELLHVAQGALGSEPLVRDIGLLESAQAPAGNGRRLTLSNDEAYDLVIAVADGTLDSVEQMVALLSRATKPW